MKAPQGLDPRGHLTVTVPADLSSRDALFDALNSGLSLPGYFGRNWDALYDVLSDLRWHPKYDQLQQVTLCHLDVLKGLTPAERQTYREILGDVVDAYSAEMDGPRFAVSFPNRWGV